MDCTVLRKHFDSRICKNVLSFGKWIILDYGNEANVIENKDNAMQ
jgi:hypothetical protein